MRYSSNHKSETRSNIVNIASRLFKVNGTDATGLAMIMKEAGLTNGAFYAHFESKEALIEAVIEQQLVDQLAQFKNELGGTDGIRRVIDIYLSEAHVVSCAEGCPSAALLGEISKRSKSTREVYSTGLTSIIDELLGSLGSKSKDDKKVLLSIFGLLIGALQLARTVTDEQLVTEIIEGSRTSAHALLDMLHSQ